MKNLKKILSSLQKASETIQLLEASGVDVNRLIGISNAQGKLGNVISGFVGAVAAIDNADDAFGSTTHVPLPMKDKTLPPVVVKRPRSIRSARKK